MSGENVNLYVLCGWYVSVVCERSVCGDCVYIACVWYVCGCVSVHGVSVSST